MVVCYLSKSFFLSCKIKHKGTHFSNDHRKGYGKALRTEVLRFAFGLQLLCITVA